MLSARFAQRLGARSLSTKYVPEAALKVRTNVFKAAIAAGDRRQIGLWTGLGSTMVAEMVSTTSGFDWFVIDMEHFPTGLESVLVQLQASQHGAAEPIVRVPWNEPVVVKRVLDMGAQTVLFPYVQNRQEAEAAVASTRYPPQGIRGVVSSQRMNNFGASSPGYYHDCAAQLCTIVQVETAEAVANIAEIGAVDGVDALFIGPSDLAASLGHLGNPGHPEVRAAIEAAFTAIRATGKAGGFLSANKADCEWVLGDLGASFCGVGSDYALLANQSRSLAAGYHDFCSTLGPV